MVELKHKRYLVTGSAGFIGGHLVEEIKRQGKEVVEIDIKTGVDVCEVRELEPLFKDVDVVFHEACSKCTVCRRDPVRDLETNALGSYNVFMASRLSGVKKVVHASTGSVNGGKPKSFYGVSKQAGENYLRAFSEYYPEFRFTSIRYHHVYGPRQYGGEGGGVIPIFINRILDGKPIEVHGDGEQQRHFTYVKDVVDFNFRCANGEFDGEFVDLAEHTPTTLNQLIRVLTELIPDRLVGGNFTEARPGDIRAFDVSRSPLPNLGTAEYDARFRENLRKTIEYYAAQKA